jgi:hypothetical protein
MKILYVASEATPYAASGGLGDVMGALPKSIVEDNPLAEVGVIVPLYNTMKSEHREQLEKVADLTFRYAWRNTGATVYKLNNSGVNYYFVENHYYFDRGRLYGEFDDAERFAFFSTAVIEFMLATNNIPDVLHANDWQTALTVVYLKTEYAHIPELRGMGWTGLLALKNVDDAKIRELVDSKELTPSTSVRAVKSLVAPKRTKSTKDTKATEPAKDTKATEPAKGTKATEPAKASIRKKDFEVVPFSVTVRDGVITFVRDGNDDVTRFETSNSTSAALAVNMFKSLLGF